MESGSRKVILATAVVTGAVAAEEWVVALVGVALYYALNAYEKYLDTR